jgi:hypothetical protein
MKRILIMGASALLATTLAACGPTDQPTTNPTTTAAAAGPAATTSAPAQAAGADAPDPCALVTQQEASTLTGAAFGPGKLEVETPASKRCVYGAQTKNVLTIFVLRGHSPDEAKAVKDQMLADLQSSDLPVNLTPVPGVGDEAQALNQSIGLGISVSAIYVLSGSSGFGIVDLVTGASAPSTASMVTQAKTVIGRL